MSYLEGDTLPEVLKVRRKDLAGTPRAMSGLKMGQHLIDKFGRTRGRSGAWISNYENGMADFERLAPEVKLELLRLYHFSDDELLYLNEHFDLRLPLKQENIPTSQIRTLGSIRTLTITGVGAYGGLERVEMWDFIIAGRDPSNVIQAPASGAVLACDEAKARTKTGSVLLFDKSMNPKEGDTVLYKIKGHETYIFRVWRQGMMDGVAVTSFDRKGAVIMNPDDPEIELMGVKFTSLDISRDADAER